MLIAATLGDPSMPSDKEKATAPKPFPKKTPVADAGQSPASLIDARIAALADWRGELLARLRALIRAADVGITEEWKWNTPVWSCEGIVCTGESYKKAVKLTFAKGAALADPSRLFNSSLDGNVRRAIDFAQGAQVDEAALQSLIRRAIALNKSAGSKR
jgi:hypothetical protein